MTISSYVAGYKAIEMVQSLHTFMQQYGQQPNGDSLWLKNEKAITPL